ncbi:hypothetical protein HNR46_002179 [Haloferula luteola]|uniref:Uncharacterized protein n=1 Tax=Haloferula luteola TaxID=595692 RepID=A0A840VDI4_9BACT|nr:hypothetical protein [Haloferula luteola]MBB5351940.1 hypothetical protein [Haloferula luteola]
MKTSLPRLVCRVFAHAFVFTSLLATVSAADEPYGTIHASPGIARVGVFPALDWEINYPGLEEVAEVDPPGKIKVLSETTMQVRLLGAGVTLSYSDGSNMSFVHTEGYFSFNNGSWQRLFAGTNDIVSQSKVLKTQDAFQGQSVRFGGHYWDTSSGRWSHFYYSNDGTQNVRVLKDGDSVPTTYNIANSPTLEQFIKPYLDSGGKIDIGPMDMIVMLELTHTDAQQYQTGYDLQDLVFLVTFSES